MPSCLRSRCFGGAVAGQLVGLNTPAGPMLHSPGFNLEVLVTEPWSESGSGTCPLPEFTGVAVVTTIDITSQGI